MGRKKVHSNKGRLRKIRHTIRTSEEEEEAIQIRMADLNEKMKLNFNEYAVLMLTKGIVVVNNFDNLIKFTSEINKIGVNINQVAHQANATNIVSIEDINYLRAQLKQIEEMINEIMRISL